MEAEINIPKQFESERADCTVIALAMALNVPYEFAHQVLKTHGRKDKRGFYIEKAIQSVCKELGFTAKQIKRSGSVRKFIKNNPAGNFLCTKRGHAFAIIDSVPFNLDTIDSHLLGAWKIEKINNSYYSEVNTF